MFTRFNLSEELTRTFQWRVQPHRFYIPLDRQAPVVFHQDLQVIFDRYSCQDLQGWSGGGRRRTRTGPGLAGSFPSGPGKYGLEVRTRPEYARRGEGRPGAPPQCPHTGAKADTNLIDMNLSAFSYTGLRDSCQDLQATSSGLRTRTCWNGPRGLSVVLGCPSTRFYSSRAGR